MKTYIIIEKDRYCLSKSQSEALPIERIKDSNDCSFRTEKEALEFIKEMAGIFRIIETTKEALDDFFQARDKYNETIREVPAGAGVVFTEKLTLHEVGLETTVVVGESGNKYELPTKHLQLKGGN